MDREVESYQDAIKDLYEYKPPTFLECVEKLKPYQEDNKNTHIENDTRNK